MCAEDRSGLFSARMTLLRISTLALALALALPTRAEDKGAAVERPAGAVRGKDHRAPSKESRKRSTRKQAPAAKSAGRDAKPAAKPCEEVKPCAID